MVKIKYWYLSARTLDHMTLVDIGAVGGTCVDDVRVREKKYHVPLISKALITTRLLMFIL